MHKLLKMMEKKKGKPLSPEFKKAKMGMLSSLKDEMSGMMKDDLQEGMKKVTVASDSKEGLKEGLEKAEDVLEEMPEGEEKEPSSEEEDMDMSLEECDSLIKKLEEKKLKLMKE